MTLIDVEALRSPRRGSLQISFRRTDQDRRPAEAVLRPNDGPGLMREQVAREIAGNLARKAIQIAGPTSYTERVAARREEVKMDLLAFIASDQAGVNARRCVAFIQTRGDVVNSMLIDLEAAGLIEHDTGAGSSALISVVTAAGREALAEARK